MSKKDHGSCRVSNGGTDLHNEVEQPNKRTLIQMNGSELFPEGGAADETSGGSQIKLSLFDCHD